MQIILLCIALLIAASTVAQSGHLIAVPQPIPPVQPPLDQSKHQIEQQNAAPDNRGTEQFPLIVKELSRDPTPQETKAAEDRAKLDREVTEYTRHLASYTKGLFWTTLVLAGATDGLAYAAFRQMREGRQAISAAEAAAKAATTQASHMEDSVAEAARATEAMQKSANAMILQAKAAINAERPFVYLSDLVLRPTGQGDESKGAIYQIAATFTNYGRSPAFVSSISIRHKCCAKPSELPEYNDWRCTGLIITPLDGTHVHSPIALATVSSSDREEIAHGKAAQWIWGRIIYKDFMGGTTEHGFIGIWGTTPAEIVGHELIMKHEFIFGINREGLEAYHYERYSPQAETND